MKKLTEHLHLRVDQGFAARFKRAASKYGNPSTVHRELLIAFIDGRVTIRPDPNKRKLEDLYSES